MKRQRERESRGLYTDTRPGTYYSWHAAVYKDTEKVERNRDIYSRDGDNVSRERGIYKQRQNTYSFGKRTKPRSQLTQLELQPRCFLWRLYIPPHTFQDIFINHSSRIPQLLQHNAIILDSWRHGGAFNHFIYIGVIYMSVMYHKAYEIMKRKNK